MTQLQTNDYLRNFTKVTKTIGQKERRQGAAGNRQLDSDSDESRDDPGIEPVSSSEIKREPLRF
jgi:hypothetical protein